MWFMSVVHLQANRTVDTRNYSLQNSETLKHLIGNQWELKDIANQQLLPPLKEIVHYFGRYTYGHVFSRGR